MNKIDKTIAIMLIIIVMLLTIISAMIIYSPSKKLQEENDFQQVSEKEEILDDCTDEFEKLEQDIVSANSEEEKISPNCQITFVKYYRGCRDEINEYITVPEDLVNKGKEDIGRYYKEWVIKEFSSNKIVLYKEFDEQCGEHYILKEDDGKINIYKILENGKETLYEKTNISVEYLPEKDKAAITSGLKINSKEKLNELIESFE